jgi:hypothetical protein
MEVSDQLHALVPIGLERSVDPRASLDVVVKRKLPAIVGGITPVIEPVTSYFLVS